MGQKTDTIVKNEVKLVKYNLYNGIGTCGCFIGGVSPELNNGLWKANDVKIKTLSKGDSLLVFMGGILTSKSKAIEGSTERMPTYLYRMAVSLKTHKVIYSGIFTNSDKPEETEVPFKEIEYKTRFYFERITRFSFKE